MTPNDLLKTLATLIAATLFAGTAAASIAPEGGDGLKARHAELATRLQKSPFGRPLHLDSRESGRSLKGDVHALLDQPFVRMRDSLADARSWCDVLTLPFNVQKCEARGDGLSVFVGRKPDSPIEEATRLDLGFTLLEKRDDLLKVQLAADQGPAGTTNYRIVFEATPMDGGRTFVHLAYGYTQGTLSGLAMQTYLMTSGANKVGFSHDGVDAEGKPRLVGGMRGVLERNTMRYFLAIEAYLAALDAPPASRRRARLEHWFDAADRYPRQLREMPRERYLALKQ